MVIECKNGICLYGFRINSLPLIIRGDMIIIFDRKDHKITGIKQSPARMKFVRFRMKLKNIESGEVERYLTMNMGCVHTPGE